MSSVSGLSFSSSPSRSVALFAFLPPETSNTSTSPDDAGWYNRVPVASKASEVAFLTSFKQTPKRNPSFRPLPKSQSGAFAGS